MARKHREEESSGTWLDTYADMVTLLLTFFVMLFSMSSVEEDKWQILLKAFTSNNGNETAQVVLVPEGDGDQLGTNQSEFPIQGSGDTLPSQSAMPETFDELYEYLKAYVEKSGNADSVGIAKEGNTIYIRFQNSIFFDADKSNLKLSGIDLLTFLGDALKNVEQHIATININGHTAAVPGVENYKINDRMLSSERASSVAIFFEEQKKIDPKKIFAIGHGKNFPVATNETEEGRAQNRRVDMMIVSSESDENSQALLEELLKGTFNADLYPKKAANGTEILVPTPAKEVADSASSEDASEVEITAEEDAPSSVAELESASEPVENRTNYDALEPK